MSTKSIAALLLVMGFLLLSCGLSTVAAVPSVNPAVPTPSASVPQISATEPPSILPEDTLSPAQATAIALAGSLLSGTATGPTANTPTRVPVQPALEGTPLPATAGKITAANAASVGEVARWGKGPASTVRFSPDGHMLAVSSPIGVYFYDPATLQEIRHVDTQATAGELAFSPDGKSVAVVVDGHELKLYDVESGQVLRTFSGHGVGVNCVAFSPDGKTLAYGLSDTTALLAEVASGSGLYTLKGHINSITSVVFLPDGKTLATASVDQSVRLWDLSTGTPIRALGEPTAAIPAEPWNYSQVAISPDGKTLASSFATIDLSIWDAATGQLVHKLGDNHAVFHSVAFSPDGKTLAAGTSDYTIWLVDPLSGNKVKELTGYRGAASAMTFSPDGQTLAVADGYSSVEVMDAHSGKVLRASKEHTGAVSQIALSADGKTIVEAFSTHDLANGAYMAFNIAGGVPHDLGSSGCYAPFALSPDGRTVASRCLPQGSDNDEVGLLDVAGGREIRTLTRQPFGTGVELDALAISPDGRTLAIGMLIDYMNAPEIRLLNIAGGNIRNSPAVFTSSVSTLAFSPDGKLLAAGSGKTTGPGGEVLEEKIRIWDAATLKELAGLPGYKEGVSSLAFSPDGKLLISGTEDQTIRIWNVAAAQEVHELHAVGLRINLAFSPDGSLLIAGTSDGQITVWDASTWAKLATLTGHNGAITGVAFTPDGQYIVSGSADGTIRFWAVHP